MNSGQHSCHLVRMTNEQFEEIEVDVFSAFAGDLYKPGLFEENNFLFSSEELFTRPS